MPIRFFLFLKHNILFIYTKFKVLNFFQLSKSNFEVARRRLGCLTTSLPYKCLYIKIIDLYEYITACYKYLNLQRRIMYRNRPGAIY